MTSTQSVVVITPIPPSSSLDSSPRLPNGKPNPDLSLRGYNIPVSAIPDWLQGDWHASQVTARLGLPLQLACWRGDEGGSRHTEVPSMLCFFMRCDLGEDPIEFGRVTIPRVRGSVIVAKVDGSDLMVTEVQAMIRYLEELGREVGEWKKKWRAENGLQRKNTVAGDGSEESSAMAAAPIEVNPDVEMKKERRMAKIKQFVEMKLTPTAFTTFMEGFDGEAKLLK